MDYESLIADLQKISQMNSISHYKRDVCAAAAIALSTLQAENLDLQAQKVRWFQINRAQEEQIDNLEAGNEKLRAELEQVKAERDAAVKCIEEIEDALNFQRMSGIGLRISEWRGQKED